MKGTTARIAAAVLGLGVIAWFAVATNAAGPYDFPHRPHLSPTAIAGTSDKDCRVCHDYAKGAREPHLAGCDQCHIDAEHLEKKLGPASTRPEFTHKEHLFTKDGVARTDVTCFSCHAMRVDGDWIEYAVPTSALGPKGVGGKPGGKFGEKTCADCHASHEPTGGLVTQDDKTGDGKACAVCHQNETSILPLKYRGDVRSAAAKPFAHKDHGAAASDCASCHGGVKASKSIWDYDPVAGTAEKCVTCHVGDGGKPLVATGDSTTVTKIDFSNFPHEKHLGEFSKMTCTTCHYPESDEQGRKVFAKRVASPEPVGRAQLVNFKVCDACHGHDGWSPTKPSWHVEGHGVGAWACFKCHEGTADAAGKLKIAAANVPSRGPVTLVVEQQLHPGIRSSAARLVDPTQDVHGATRQCTDCHIADVVASASPSGGGRFVHDPHVRATPTAENCQSCHKTIGLARRSEDAAYATRGMGDCLVCHAGAGVSTVGHSNDSGRLVPEFDHAGHIQTAALLPGEKGIGCTECHVPGGVSGYSIPADVLNCTKCHAHEGDAAKVARTGPKTSQGDAAKCLFCHDKVRGDESGSVGAPKHETISREHLFLGRGKQFHDKTGDCAACHVRDGAADMPYVERITKASVRTSIHEDAKFKDRPFNDPKSDCTTCHRTPPRGYLRSLSGR
jgi:hypothetical protein